MPEKKWDTIVIGAGLAGLYCAARLAKAGQKTLVIEQHHVPGGYWTSFVRKGVVFDITPHWTTDHNRVNQMLAEHGVAPLAFEQHRQLGRYLGPDPQWDIWLSCDKGRFEASVLSSFPGVSREAVKRLCDLCLRINAELNSLPSRNLELMNRVSQMLSLAPMLFRAPNVMRYAKMPANNFLESLFPGNELQGLRTLLHLAAPIPGISAIGVIAMLGFALRGQGYSPVGGAQMIGNAFAEAAQRSGAEIRYGQRVRRIVLNGGWAAGLELVDDSRLEARSVVAAIDAHQIYGELIDPTIVPQDFRARLDAYSVSDPYVIVSLVTDLDPAAYGFDGTDTFVAQSIDLEQGLAPDDPEHSIYSLVFPRYRTAGANPAHHGIQIVSPATFEHADYWQAGPGLERGSAYQDFKLAYARRLIERVETRLPGLGEHILALDVATPLTMWRYTLNYHGAPIGWGYKNPQRWTQRVPFIGGLYQAGHWVGPSGVLNAGASGQYAAELILHDVA